MRGQEINTVVIVVFLTIFGEEFLAKIRLRYVMVFVELKHNSTESVPKMWEEVRNLDLEQMSKTFLLLPVSFFSRHLSVVCTYGAEKI